MHLSRDDILEFKKIFFAETGEQIDDARALKESQRLLTLISFAIRGKSRKQKHHKKSHE